MAVKCYHVKAVLSYTLFYLLVIGVKDWFCFRTMEVHTQHALDQNMQMKVLWYTARFKVLKSNQPRYFPMNFSPLCYQYSNSPTEKPHKKSVNYGHHHFFTGAHISCRINSHSLTLHVPLPRKLLPDYTWGNSGWLTLNPALGGELPRKTFCKGSLKSLALQWTQNCSL